jgi:uncharacterized membrane protein YqaE (UPF0057 family)
MSAVLTVLAVLCPPAAVLAVGTRGEASKSLLLTGLLYLPGVMHALRVVDRHQTRQRFALVLRAMAADASG